MLLNNFKISMRYLLKNRTFSAINLLGLTLGFLSFLLIALYLHDELNFDSFHADSEQIYRVIQHEQLEDGSIRNVAQVAAPLASSVIRELPEVTDATRISVMGRIAIGNDPNNRDYERIKPADENFFSLFNFPLLQGDLVTALQQPFSVVISEKLATKYFGSEPALGQQIWTELTQDGQPVYFQVTGVMKDFPKNSHLHLDMLISNATFVSLFDWYREDEETYWEGNQFITYIKVRPGADIHALEDKLTSLVKNHYPVEKEFRSTYSLQPLREIHLSSANIQERVEISTNTTKPFYLYLFGIVGFLILLIACLNYLNLSTAAAYQRTREIGTRKTLGAQIRQLVTQFLGEAMILSILALLLAIACLQTLLPTINTFLDKDLSIWELPATWQLGLVAVTILAGIGASLYPAFIIARISPSVALKKEIRLGRQSLPVRKMLVASQLAISILMIASTLVIYRQLNYMEDKDLGFALENLLVIDINSNNLRNDFEKVKTEFRRLSEVQTITASTSVPGEWKTFPIASVSKAEDSRQHETIYVGIDKDFLSTYDIPLMEGRNFTSGTSDSTKVILTQLAVEQLGLTDPVGQILEIPDYRFGAQIRKFESPLQVEVIGVAENFYFESFKHQMMPLIFAYANTEVGEIDYYTLKITTNNWSETLEKLEAVNRKLEPVDPLEYNFLNDRFEDFYRADEKQGLIFLIASIEIVLIACMGLFALVSYSVESRTKEIGIRKILGATVSNILLIIAREFVPLVLLAATVALPLAWYLMNAWLSDFAYRITLGPDTFLLAALLSILITAATISLRTIKAAIANPVDSLRNE